jgi:hypothetical protein
MLEYLGKEAVSHIIEIPEQIVTEVTFLPRNANSWNFSLTYDLRDYALGQITQDTDALIGQRM